MYNRKSALSFFPCYGNKEKGKEVPSAGVLFKQETTALLHCYKSLWNLIK